jgi:hypothetical protein
MRGRGGRFEKPRSPNVGNLGNVGNVGNALDGGIPPVNGELPMPEPFRRRLLA